jgi:D-alanine-D-alanine ligase
MDSGARLWEIPVKLLMRNSTKDIEEDLEAEAKPVPYESLQDRVDVVCLGLHGKYGEDGCMQGLLELLRVPYTAPGSWLGDRHGQRGGPPDPGHERDRRARTIPVPRRLWEQDRDRVCGRIAGEIGFPCIVKPSREGAAPP